VTRGLVDIERQDVDVKTVVAGAVEQVRPLIEARGHELVLRIAAAHARVLGDRTRLVQVIGNLLTNAAKYTPSGGRIALLVETVDGKVRISVTDNGDGIDSALLPQVFDLFAQGERTPDRAQGGLGLGLALVKSIVALHGGEVRAHSDGHGRGSVFTIELQATALPSGRAEAATQDGVPPPAAPLRIMLVDDNADAAFTLASLLEAAGCSVTSMDGPGAALESAAAQDTDVFILDIGMPGMDGYELARRLRRNPRNADAVYIALTGYGQAHDRAHAQEAGFHHHFVKPVDFRQLAAAIGEVGRFRKRLSPVIPATRRDSA
jgi:CheY-like chemotaxis protein/anti-sigma regulatory factor (Ser/Thr protein kinase)